MILPPSAAELAARGVKRVIGAATGRIIGAQGFEAHGVAGFHLPAGPLRRRRHACSRMWPALACPKLRARVRAVVADLGRCAGAR